MSQAVGSYTYTGVWINWSAGRVLGSTITLSARNGGLLTAFLSIFVTVAGDCCWKITSFALHQYRCKQDYQDGLHCQHQVLFRNDTSALDLAWHLTQSMWAWRKSALRPFIRTLPFALLALMNAAFFGVAGIFSSETTKAAGNETLIRSPNCGALDLNSSLLYATGPQQPLRAQNISQDTNDTNQASAYVKACYGASQDTLQCNHYVKAEIPWETNSNVTCPFAEGLCWWGDSAAYEMDSGLIDSHEALGINAKKADRVQFRKVTTCSPLHTKDHATELNVTDPTLVANGDTLDQSFFGPVVDTSNYTYSYNEHSRVEDHGYEL